MTARRPIHQLLPDLTLACGHDGTERAVLDPARVTCDACRPRQPHPGPAVNRAELEALIWRLASRPGGLRCVDIDTILAAVDTYAAYTAGDIVRARHAVIEEAVGVDGWPTP